LADREDFAAIYKLLSQMRIDQANTIDRTENANKHFEPLPEAIEVIHKYVALVERLQIADRVKLAHAISLTVASITIESRTATTGDIEHPELVGTLQLHKSLATTPIIIRHCPRTPQDQARDSRPNPPIETALASQRDLSAHRHHRRFPRRIPHPPC
jgi:hypothetical protein